MTTIMFTALMGLIMDVKLGDKLGNSLFHTFWDTEVMGRKRLQQDNLILSTKLMMNEWRMANSWNVMFRDRHGDKFTLSTQLPTQN